MVNQNDKSHGQNVNASAPVKKSKNNNPSGKNQYTSGRANNASADSDQKKW